MAAGHLGASLGGQGQDDGEGRALSRPVQGGDLAPVLEDDLLGDGQAEPGALGLGGDEELEDVQPLRQPRPGVVHAEPRPAVHEAALHPYPPSLGHGLDRVSEQVEQDLLHASAIEAQGGKGLPDPARFEAHSPRPRLGGEKPHDLLREVGQGGFVVVWAVGPREKEEILDQGVQALDLRANDPRQRIDLARRGRAQGARLALQPGELEGDGVQRVSHLVREARGKGPEGGHLLALGGSRLGIPKLAKGLALGLAVSSGLDPQRDLVADRLQEAQLAVVEARPLARSHVEHSPAPPLEAQGDAGMGDGSFQALDEVGHPRALGGVVGEHALTGSEDLAAQAGPQSLVGHPIQVVAGEATRRGQT